MNHEHNKYSGYGISSDELHIIMHLCTSFERKKRTSLLEAARRKNDENVHWQEDFCDSAIT